MGLKIAHVGAFDIENYGDLLFPDVLRLQLEKRVDVDCIDYFSPKECIMPNTSNKVHSLIDLEKLTEKNRYDAIILGGGDFIHLKKVIMLMPHISDDWMTYEVLYMWVIPSLVSKKYNIPLLWNAPGVPIEFNDLEKRVVNLLTQYSDYISVRDYQAKKVLQTAVRSDLIHVIPDTVLSISELLPKKDLDIYFNGLTDLENISRKKYILFQGNVAISEDDLKVCADTLKKISDETGWKVLLQPIGFALGDEGVLNKIYSFYPDDFIMCSHHTQYEILSLIANASLYIGTSLHGCITSNSYLTNSIVYNLNRYNKTNGFSELVNRKDFVVYDAKDIYNAFKRMRDVDESTIKLLNKRIDSHFDTIVSIIATSISTNKKDLNIVDLVEIIFDFCELSQEIKVRDDKLIEYDKSLRELMDENIILRSKYNLAINELQEIRNSTSWKITKPIRKISSLIKNK